MLMHGETRDDTRALWVMVPVGRQLKGDLITLASVHRTSIGDYCAHALDRHVNGQRALLDGVDDATQKEPVKAGLDSNSKSTQP